MEEKHTCEVDMRVDSFSVRYHTCGKPAKGQLKDGKWACGIHLAAERKREAHDARFRKELEDHKLFGQDVRALAVDYDIPVYVGDANRRTVILPYDALVRALRRLREEER